MTLIQMDQVNKSRFIYFRSGGNGTHSKRSIDDEKM